MTAQTSPDERQRESTADGLDLADAGVGESGPPTRGELLDALSNRRRRYALHYLQFRNGAGPVELSEVSTQVAAWELGIEPQEVRYSDRKNVHTSLYQFHAPKLDELGLIDFEERSNTVSLTSYGEGVWLCTGTRGRSSRRVRYLGAASAFSAVAVGATFLVPGVAFTVGGWMAATIAVVFVLTAVWCWYDESAGRRLVEEDPPKPTEDR